MPACVAHHTPPVAQLARCPPGLKLPRIRSRGISETILHGHSLVRGGRLFKHRRGPPGKRLELPAVKSPASSQQGCQEQRAQNHPHFFPKRARPSVEKLVCDIHSRRFRPRGAQEPARPAGKGPPDRQPHAATRSRGSIVAATATGGIREGPSTNLGNRRATRRGSRRPDTVRGRPVQTLAHPSCNVYHHRPEAPCARQESVKYCKNAIRAAGGRPVDHRPMPMQGTREARFPPTGRGSALSSSHS